MDSIAVYILYLVAGAASGAWIYADAKKRSHPYPRSVALGATVVFPVGLLVYVLSR